MTKTEFLRLTKHQMPQNRGRISPRRGGARRSRSRSPYRPRERRSPHRKSHSRSRSPSPPSRQRSRRLSPKRFRSRSHSPKVKRRDSHRHQTIHKESSSRSRSRERTKQRTYSGNRQSHWSEKKPKDAYARRRNSTERISRSSHEQSKKEKLDSVSNTRLRRQSLSPLLVPYSRPSPPDQSHSSENIKRKLIHPDREEQSLTRRLLDISRLHPERTTSPPPRSQRVWSSRRSPPLVDEEAQEESNFSYISPETRRYRPVSHERSAHRSRPGPIYLDGTMMRATKISLNERHARGNYVHPFRFEDNITICIRRHGPNLRDSPSMIIVRRFNPDTFIIQRRDNEGNKPIFDREEIKVFRHDDNLNEEIVYEESRVVSVAPSERFGRIEEHSLSHRHHTDSEFDRHRTSSQHSDRSEDRRVAQPKQEIRFLPRPDPRYEALYKEVNRVEESKKLQKLEKIQRNPNDLRHNLMRLHSEEKFDARHRIESKQDSRSSDRRQVVRRGREVDANPNHEIDRRSPKPRSKIEEPLPDFSRRPDKYRYEEWKEKPELIPRNSSYFEHDNREGFSGRGRSQPFSPRRGRGAFQSRRPSYRPVPSSRRQSPDRYWDNRRVGRWPSGEGGSWKHDKFKSHDKDEDQKPSSTTKN